MILTIASSKGGPMWSWSIRPGLGNRAATVAITAADAVLIPVLPGAGDIWEAERTLELVGAVAAGARRAIPARVVWNRMRPSDEAFASRRHQLSHAQALGLAVRPGGVRRNELFR